MTYSRVVWAAMAGLWWVTTQRLAAQQDEPVQSYTIHIQGDDSKPIEGAKVWVTRDYPQFPAVLPDSPRGSARGTTDTNGQATVRLPGNSFNLMATLDGYAPLFLRGLTADPRQVIEARLSRGQTISGQIMTADHKPVGSATVIARRANFAMSYMDEFTPKAKTSPDGKFSIEHAAEADYLLSVQSASASGQWSFDSLALQVKPNSQTAPVEMVAKAGVVIEGKLTGPDGVNVGNRRVTVLIRLPAEIRWETTTNPDGSFTLTNIPAGCIGTIAFPTIRDYATITSITQPSHGLNPKINSIDLKMPEAGTYRGVEARFIKMVEIQGQVIDPTGAPLAGAMIIAEPTSRIFTSDADGHFTALLPPGVEARLRIGGSNTMNASSGPTFKVTEGKNEDQTLMAVPKVELPHADEITGKVVDAQGQPVPGAIVSINNSAILPRSMVLPGRGAARPTWQGGMSQPAQLTADSSGAFRFDKLDPGKTDIWASQGVLGWGFKERISSTARDVVI
ncbi:MAG TPA: carboxypeptidase-like regulatory domain-containing protein [Tepidisphaeraceae bacterium]|nr:carboxypeptidase-like regulatory domain-containing protein [Tepidisphaeraceae bacterium]